LRITLGGGNRVALTIVRDQFSLQAVLYLAGHSQPSLANKLMAFLKTGLVAAVA
jgi:hypothetical protein